METHTLCKTDNPILSTRVLDVGRYNGDVIKLCVPSSGQTARYICLSHCWGSMSFIQTDIQNIADHMEGILWTVLTKTFQDAIQVCRKLGIQWLWIDSLCIIQDDTNDWDQESAKMASIYENSYLTIAATSSSDGNGGLLFPKNDYRFVHCSKNGSRYPIHVRCLAEEHLEPSWNTRLEAHPVLNRGWCYQERLLAPRVLHFGCHDVM